MQEIRFSPLPSAGVGVKVWPLVLLREGSTSPAGAGVLPLLLLKPGQDEQQDRSSVELQGRGAYCAHKLAEASS